MCNDNNKELPSVTIHNQLMLRTPAVMLTIMMFLVKIITHTHTHSTVRLVSCLNPVPPEFWEFLFQVILTSDSIYILISVSVVLIYTHSFLFTPWSFHLLLDRTRWWFCRTWRRSCGWRSLVSPDDRVLLGERCQRRWRSRCRLPPEVALSGRLPAALHWGWAQRWC